MVLTLGTAEDLEIGAGQPIEEPQAEPYSDYYSYGPGTLLLVDSDWSIPAHVASGYLQVGVLPPPPGLHPSQVLNGAVLEVQDEERAPLAITDPAIANRYTTRLFGRWVRLSQPVPASLSAQEIFRILRDADPRREPLKACPVYNGSIKTMGAVFPEERRWRGSSEAALGDAWIFAVQFTPSVYAGKSKKKPRQEETVFIARGGFAGRADLAARVPELPPLQQHAVAVFGLGCIGAPSALEFARAGTGELRILDRDHVDPATVVRWPLGFSVAGQQKVEALGRFILANYPYTRLVTAQASIGSVRNAQGLTEQEILDTMLGGATLLYDATAEYGVQRYLADKAAEYSIPYVGVQATAGGWGGLVVRIVPGQTEGCWICLQLARDPDENDEAIKIPAPPADPRGGDLQPPGCATPTFTGSNFDTMEVAITGVRMAVSTLRAGLPGSYPETDWDVVVLSLRTEAGKLQLPHWQAFRLRKHPRCLACASRA